MVKQPNSRFAIKEDAPFSGLQIDRDRPVSFVLEGKSYQGYAGDSILSALLASGVDTIGELGGEPVALDAELCPPVVVVGKSDQSSVLPLERTPLLDGMVLRFYSSETAAQKIKRSPIERVKRSLSGESQRTLDLDLSSGDVLPGPWVDLPSVQELETDLVVVGGGVAGLSAALAAAQSGWAVALIERRTSLGGDARFFGSQEGEQRPDQFILELEGALTAYEKVQIFTNSLALSLSRRGVRVHQITTLNDRVHGEILRISGRKTILATGMPERLPVFPGNRLPGVMKAREAFHLAAKYGVWRGGKAAFCTSSSAATQVALLAADMGVKVAKLADSRSRPKSRFFEFAKAYGISLATGTQVASASPGKRGRLNVQFALTSDSSMQSPEVLEVDRLVVCGGWQPDLTLWHGAGGRSVWQAERCQLLGVGELVDTALAGSCAGVLSMNACANSGREAFYDLSGMTFEGKALATPDIELESDDGYLPVVHGIDELETCFLDTGYSFTRPAQGANPGLLARLWRSRTQKETITAGRLKVLSLNEVAAKVVLGEIPAEYSGIIAQERCIHAGRFANGVQAFQGGGPVTGRPPAYLTGRFGKRERVVELKSDNASAFEIGCPIYLDTETTAPTKAIGVVFKIANGGSKKNLAYVDASAISKGHKMVVRNNTHTILASVASDFDEQQE